MRRPPRGTAAAAELPKRDAAGVRGRPLATTLSVRDGLGAARWRRGEGVKGEVSAADLGVLRLLPRWPLSWAGEARGGGGGPEVEGGGEGAPPPDRWRTQPAPPP